MLQPPPEMTLSQWADKFRRLSAGSSAEPGRWKTAKAPYQKEIMDAITDITIKKVVIMSAAQVGKTDAMVLNPIGYYVHYDPSPIMVIQPTIDMAEKFSKEKLSPMLRDTPVLADRINEKSRNSGNTIMQKIFPGGFITIAGANSPTGLRSHTIRILLADEIDAYPASAGKEGDPLLLASKRQTTFWNKKQVDISTPTVKGASRIEVEYENSSRGEWNAPCPCCGELQPLVWSNVVFALKVTTMNVVIYDAAEYDSKPPIKTIKYGSGDYISYKLGTSLHDTAYTSCHVSYTDPDSKETIESTYTADSTEGTGQTLEVNEKVRSTNEAYELAKKRLREKNTQQFTASFTMLGDVQLVAGATVKLKGFQKFDRKYKITKATHKLTGGYTTQIELQQVLEGY